MWDTVERERVVVSTSDMLAINRSVSERGDARVSMMLVFGVVSSGPDETARGRWMEWLRVFHGTKTVNERDVSYVMCDALDNKMDGASLIGRMVMVNRDESWLGSDGTESVQLPLPCAFGAPRLPCSC